MAQKSSRKGNENWSIQRRGKRKKRQISEIKHKLQNVQGRMDLNENLTTDIEEKQENKRMKMR